MVLCPGALEGSTVSGSGFKASQKTEQRLKVLYDRLREFRSIEHLNYREADIKYITPKIIIIRFFSYQTYVFVRVKETPLGDVSFT